MSSGSEKTLSDLPRMGQAHIALLGAAFTLVLLILILWQASTIYEENLIFSKQAEIDTQLLSSGNSLENQIYQYFSLLEGLDAFARANPTEEAMNKHFPLFAFGLYSGSPAIRSIEIYTNFSETYVYPVTGNEVAVERTMADLINDERPLVRDDVQGAIHTRQMVVTGPYEMQRGGQGIVARQAVYINDSLWGIVSIVIDVPSLLSESGLVSGTEHIEGMALRDDSGQLLFGSNGTFLLEPLIYSVALPSGSWELAAVPKGGWENSVADTQGIFEKGGIIIVLLLTLLVYLLLNYGVSLKTQVSERTALLKESENRYLHLTDTARDFIIVHDLEGRILYANRIAVEFSGYSEDELLSKNVTQFVAPDEIEKMINRRYQRIGDDREKYLYETVFIDKNGNEIPVEVSSVPMEGKNGKPSILIIARDITERKKTQSDLLKSEEMFATVFNTVPDGIMLSTFEGEIISVNESFLKNQGFLQNELLGSSICDINLWIDSDICEEYMEKLNFHGFVRNFESEIITKTGDIHPVIISGDIIPTNDERYILTVFRDVTDIKHTEDELKRSKSLLDEVSEIANIGGWSLDVSSGNITWTPEVFNIHDMEPRDSVDVKEAIDYYAPGSKEIISKAVKDAVDNGEPYALELELITSKGKHKWVRASGRPVFTDGKVTKLIGSFQDITERKNVELALLEQEQLLKEMGNVAKIGGWDFDVNSGTSTWTSEVAIIHDLDPDIEANVDLSLKSYTPESREILSEAFNNAVEKGEPYDLELEFISAKGVHKWVRTGAQPIFIDDKVVKVVGFLQDITHIKKVEFELQKQGVLLDEVGDIAKIGGWEFDVSTGEGTWTPEVARIHGLDPDDPTSKDVGLSFFVSESKEKIQTAIRDAIEKAQPYDLELELISADGVNKWVRTLGRPVLEDGKVVKLTGSMQDITDRKLAADRLLESELRVKKKLDAILEPEGDLGELDLVDIIDIETLQSIMDEFYRLTNIGGMAILDLKGNVLVNIGWQDICTKFHRVHPETCKHCIESDLELTRGVEPGTYKFYKCKNNMWDMVTPIVLGGIHIGNLYVGQFFLDDEEIPYDTFRLQAKKYGFDEKEYLETLDRVPRWSREKVDSLMTYYSLLTNLISTLSYSNVKLARTLNERDELLASLRESEERFRATFEQAAVGMCLANMDGFLIQMNQRFCDITGYGHEELIRMNFADVTYQEDIGKELSMVEELVSGERNDYSIEKRYVRKDKNIIWVKVTVAIVKSSDGKPLYFIAMIEDIDSRKQAEAEILQYNERLNMLHHIDTDIISSVSSEKIAEKVVKQLRKLVPCDSARLRLFDASTKQAVILAADSDKPTKLSTGTHNSIDSFLLFDKLLSGETLLIPDINKQIKSGTQISNVVLEENIRSCLVVPLIIEDELIAILNLSSTEYDFFTKEHEQLVEEVAKQLSIALHQSKLREQISQHADELEQRVVERTSQLEAANKELEAFTYSVSHDLRAPLRAIDGFSRIITEDYESNLDDEGMRLLNVIRTNTQKMDKLITDLLGLSRVGRNEMNCVQVNMRSLVSSVLNELMANEEKDNFVFNVSDIPDSYADSALIKQLWTNLLSNAIKYSSTQEKAIVEVGSYTEDGMNVYYIKDNGVGFDSKYVHKLFGIFQRLHSEKEFPGTGVGLAIVQRIAKRHGGDVWAEGESDKGATFYFSLPVKDGGDMCGE
ncbi:PAS domain S-box protein [Methanolobus bombayensis]|uniref:PAS domain S-box protein n=1 Tax=Methanolobus bombayensis TaxID=38023 RepID=UPI001AE740DA|nr:PAS domain S-box protein [Methanolobus bombayensis]MBP1907945.1 PAS domain S-box-containing protein [Methanolobus bombayensis]